MRRPQLENQMGFSLVELVVVILVLGILAAVAVPVFFDLDDYRERSAYDETAGALRYAQKLAVGSGCEVRVVISPNGYQLQQRGGVIAAGAACPTGTFADLSGFPITAASFSDVSLTPVTLTFDAMGRCSSNATITVGTTQTISVVAATGVVNAP